MMQIGLSHYLILGTLLFAVGVYGVLVKKNLISVLMAIELMLNGVNINLVAANRYLAPDQAVGQVWAILVMAVAAAEVAIGLALALAVYRARGEIELDKFDFLKW
jgi:NADH:ubiquinone oxidoreductase subunit K